MHKQRKTKPSTVQDWKDQGFEVRVIHRREHSLYGTVQAKGGATIVTISSPENNNSFTGVASCHDNDNYDKKRGVQIALGRAARASYDATQDGEPWANRNIVRLPKMHTLKKSCRVVAVSEPEESATFFDSTVDMRPAEV